MSQHLREGAKAGAPGPRQSYAETVRSLSAAQKAAAPGAPAYSLFVNRRAGRYLAAACHRLGLGPNAVSAVSAVFTYGAIVLLATAAPAWPMAVAVWLMLAVGYAFDSADGQVARLRGGGSLAGEWLDHVLDSIKLSTLHLALAVCAYRFFDLPDAGWLLVPLGFCVVANVSFFAMILNDQLKARHTLGTGNALPKRTGSRLRSVLLIPTDYGFLCLVFLLIPLTEVFLVVYTALLFLNAAHLFLAAPKWFRDFSRLEASA